MSDQKDIDDPCLGYARNMTKWTLPRDLLGGSYAMREGSDPQTGIPWLPRYTSEEPEDWAVRRENTVLHGLFSAGVNRLASQPFGKAVQVSDVESLNPRFVEAPDGSSGYLEDVDGDGMSFTDFARACYEDAAAYGITHALALHTAHGDDDRNGRPILEHVPALSLIGWIHDDNGTLIDCRISGTMVDRDPDNPWNETEHSTVRRYFLAEDGTVYSELYVIDEDAKRAKQNKQSVEPRYPAEQLVAEDGQPLDEIPLFTLYFNRTGRMEAEPPLFSLAEANVDHFRALSDYVNATHGAAVPMLAMTGIAADVPDDSEEVSRDSVEKISVHRVLKSSRQDAKFFWVEISGAACEAARVRVQDIETRSESLGGQPKTRAGVGTATAVWVDERASEGRMSSWNRATEAFLTLCLWQMGDWMGSRVPREVVVNIPEDRPLTQGRLDEVAAILSVFNSAGDLLDRKTALTAIRSIVPSLEKVDIEEVLEVAQSELRRAGFGDEPDEIGAGVDIEDDEEDEDGDE